MASRTPPAEPLDSDSSSAEDSSTTDGSPSAESSATEGDGPRSTRFFSWMRHLGVPRHPGWIGGVAAGVGQRVGVDPIIVRGIIVVVAVLGGPALLLYAAAWLLLPDTKGRIHAEDLGRGRFDPALVGIGVMALLSFLPLNQGFWWVGAAFWGDLSLGASVGRALWTGLLLAGIVALIIVVARRSTASPTVVPATTDDKPDSIPAPAQPAEQAAESLTVGAPESSAPPPEAPPEPASDAGADELQAWKERQTLWKQQHAEWKAQQTATERELRRQHALDVHEKALAASAERAERRRLRTLANPRINAATAWAALGTSIIAGGVAALASAGNADVGGHEATIALAVSAITLGLSVVIAGAFRRRSGVLSFFALVAVLAMLISAAVPRDRSVFVGGISWGVGGDTRIAVPVGPIYLDVHNSPVAGVTDIWQGAGNAELHVGEGSSVRVELRTESGHLSIYDQNGRGEAFNGINRLPRSGGGWVWTAVLGPDPDPSRTIRLEQNGGRLVIYDDNADHTPAEETPAEETDPTAVEGVQP